MMILNYDSGEVVLKDDTHELKLARDAANRLIMMARMHTVQEFIDKLPTLISNEDLLKKISTIFDAAPSSTDRWNLKEKFARLTTLTKGYVSKNPESILEQVSFQ